MRTILVNAMGCAPGCGSELGVGWNWVIQMAKSNSVHVLTVTRRKEEIENAIPQECRSSIMFHYYDLPKVMIRLLPPGTILFYVQCLLWQLGIYPLIRKLKKHHHFDYSMHLTFGSIWIPTILPLFDIPFIWGPFGGVEGVSKSFLKSLGGNFYDVVMDRLRFSFVRSISINPIILFSLSRAKVILVRTNDTGKAIPGRFQHKVKQVLETAMEELPLTPSFKDNNPNRKIRLLSTGRLIPSKNYITAIKALSMLNERYDFTYTMVGSGPDKERLEREIKERGLEGVVEFIENIPREKVLSMLCDYDIYLFPSLREAGSWALMEAMVAKLPVICLDSSGMSVITDDKSAIRLKVSTPEQVVTDMACAIEKLINEPEERKRLGEMAHRRVRTEFCWEAKGLFMEKIFDQLDLR